MSHPHIKLAHEPLPLVTDGRWLSSERRWARKLIGADDQADTFCLPTDGHVFFGPGRLPYVLVDELLTAPGFVRLVIDTNFHETQCLLHVMHRLSIVRPASWDLVVIAADALGSGGELLFEHERLAELTWDALQLPATHYLALIGHSNHAPCQLRLPACFEHSLDCTTA